MTHSHFFFSFLVSNQVQLKTTLFILKQILISPQKPRTITNKITYPYIEPFYYYKQKQQRAGRTIIRPIRCRSHRRITRTLIMCMFDKKQITTFTRAARLRG